MKAWLRNWLGLDEMESKLDKALVIERVQFVDISTADRIIIVCKLDLSHLPKARAEIYKTEVISTLRTVFPDPERYTILVIPKVVDLEFIAAPK